MNEPESKKTLTNLLSSKYVPLQERGFPSSLSKLVRNLIDCGWDEFLPDDAYPSLKAASDDLHLLLKDPNRFLFDFTGSGQVGELRPKRTKLYGRDNEISLITDTFCRVAISAASEALFVDGFSGSGKSRLIESALDGKLAIVLSRRDIVFATTNMVILSPSFSLKEYAWLEVM
jgi:hypothetical protein